jgi:hypothetical protein
MLRRFERLSVEQNVDDAGHLLLDQPADVRLHRLNFFVNRQVGQPVVFKLAELLIDRRRDELLSHCPSPLLVDLLPPQVKLVDGRRRRRQQSKSKQKTEVAEWRKPSGPIACRGRNTPQALDPIARGRRAAAHPWDRPGDRAYAERVRHTTPVCATPPGLTINVCRGTWGDAAVPLTPGCCV